MRHKVKSTRINRNSAQLKALVRSLVTAIILREDVSTTKPKAKIASALLDRIISKAKIKDKMNWIRYIKRYLYEESASIKVIEDLVERYKDRQSGFTRIVKTKNRPWDNAQMVKIQLV